MSRPGAERVGEQGGLGEGGAGEVERGSWEMNTRGHRRQGAVGEGGARLREMEHQSIRLTPPDPGIKPHSRHPCPPPAPLPKP